MIKKISYFIRNKNEGVVLHLSLLLVASFLLIASAIATILIGEFVVSGDIRKSMGAIYAADSGLEAGLYEVRKVGYGDAIVDCAVAPFNLVLPAGSFCNLEIIGTAVPGGDIVIRSRGENSGFFRKIRASYLNI